MRKRQKSVDTEPLFRLYSYVARQAVFLLEGQQQSRHNARRPGCRCCHNQSHGGINLQNSHGIYDSPAHDESGAELEKADKKRLNITFAFRFR